MYTETNLMVVILVHLKVVPSLNPDLYHGPITAGPRAPSGHHVRAGHPVPLGLHHRPELLEDLIDHQLQVVFLFAWQRLSIHSAYRHNLENIRT